MRPKQSVEHAEAEFHDAWAASVDVNAIDEDRHFDPAGCPENAQVLTWMGDLRNKRVLDVGCGRGEASVYFAKRGADVTAVDISPGMVALTSALAHRAGVRVSTACLSSTGWADIPNDSFDYVYAANVLHHVDIPAVASELRRKLKPGGTAFFWDPLAYNPAINLYRRMATKVRTEDEHPLRLRDVAVIRKIFGATETRFFWYAAQLIFIKYFVVDRLHPNDARYWKKVVDDAPRFGRTMRLLHRVDRWLFASAPGIKWLAWNVLIRAHAIDGPTGEAQS